MSLTNTQYDQLMRMYSLQQSENERALRERTQFAYEKIPQLSALDARAGELTLAGVKASLDGNQIQADAMKASLQELKHERAKLLAARQLPADYLQMQYHCPDCSDTGYIGARRCHCFSRHVAELFYTQSGLKDILQRENFDHFRLDLYADDHPHPATGLTPRENMAGILAQAKDFAAGFIAGGTHQSGRSENLLLYGGTGLGKTFLSHCIAKELMDHSLAVLYFSAAQLFETMADEAFRKTRSDQAVTPALETCDLCIIDDLGTEMTNTFVASALFQIVNTRLNAGKSTLINTNLSLSAFADTYTERVFSRITSHYRLLGLYGEDIRLKLKLRRNYA